MAAGVTRVTGQMVTTALSGGRFVKGVEVAFVTTAGNAGSVFVPQDQYTPDAVRTAIAEAAATMDAVGSITL
ncbi:MAG TPA: hypothetical protein VHQ90_00110 [Thermoanaerobaculia bacterium]|nr:hypothetical protein [Thermoanaerobaculia bacterium]